MWDNIKEFILNMKIESWLSLYFLINMFILGFSQDITSSNTLIHFYASFILVFVLSSISTLRYENEEIKKLIKKLTK